MHIALVTLLFEADQKAGVRLFLSGEWAGLGGKAVPETVMCISDVSQVGSSAGVIHHGGAGTTATALAAGVPSGIVPSLADQPFRGRTLATLGVGPGPIPRRKSGWLTLQRSWSRRI